MNELELRSKISFEHFLKNNLKEGNEFRLVVTQSDENLVEFYCHPLGRDGQTFDAYVFRSCVEPKKAMDNLAKALKTNGSKK